MIQKIEIKNFQSHENSVLRFVSGVNAIIGKTDSGKSAILRALKWVITNKPGGEDFRRHDTKETAVKLFFEDFEVLRKKTTSKNEYYLNSDKFVAFGNKPPSEIYKSINMDLVNFQNQLDAPFLISESNGSIAKYFNSVAKLEKIDSSISYLNKYSRKQKSSANFTKEQIAELSEKEKELFEKSTFVNSVNFLEKEIIDFEKLKGNQITIVSILELISENSEFQKNENIILKNENIIFQLEKFFLEKKEIQLQIEIIISKLETYQSIKFNSGLLEKEIENEPVIIKTLNLLEKINYFHKTTDKISSTVNHIKELKKSRKTLKNELFKLETNFNTNFPNICPLCNSQIKE